MIAWFRRWRKRRKCWRDWKRLHPAAQALLRYFNMDPDSMIKRGDL